MYSQLTLFTPGKLFIFFSGFNSNLSWASSIGGNFNRRSAVSLVLGFGFGFGYFQSAFAVADGHHSVRVNSFGSHIRDRRCGPGYGHPDGIVEPDTKKSRYRRTLRCKQSTF